MIFLKSSRSSIVEMPLRERRYYTYNLLQLNKHTTYSGAIEGASHVTQLRGLGLIIFIKNFEWILRLL